MFLGLSFCLVFTEYESMKKLLTICICFNLNFFFTFGLFNSYQSSSALFNVSYAEEEIIEVVVDNPVEATVEVEIVEDSPAEDSDNNPNSPDSTNYHQNFPYLFTPGYKSTIMNGSFNKDNFKNNISANLISPILNTAHTLGESRSISYELFCPDDSLGCPDLISKIDEIDTLEDTEDKIKEIKKLDLRSPSQGHCVLNHPDEYRLARVSVGPERRDEDGSSIWLQHYRVPKGTTSTSKISDGRIENIRGYKKLWLNIMKDVEPRTEVERALPGPPPFLKHDSFFEGEVGVGPRTTNHRKIYEFLPACQDGYRCLPQKKTGEIEFFGDGLQVQEEPNTVNNQVVSDSPTPEEVRCTDGDQCSSGICTPQSKVGLIANWNFSKQQVQNLEMDEDLPYYTKDSYCQPIRRCYRTPTPEFGRLEYEDDYCAPGLLATNDGMCIDANIALIDLNRVPLINVDMNTCAVTMGEASLDSPTVPLEEPTSPLYCSLPGHTTQSSCVEAGGVWNRVQIKMAKLNRLMLGLEWMWSRADMKNVLEPKGLKGQKKFLNQGEKVQRIMQQFANVRRQISAAKNANIFESMQMAKTLASQGDQQTGYLTAMKNYYQLMQATSFAEANLFKELYSKKKIEQLANGQNINYFNEIAPSNLEPFEETLFSVKKANDKAYWKHYMKDGQGGSWNYDESDLEDDDNIACKDIVAGDRGNEGDEMAEVCDAYHDGGYCLFYITNRNCVQDAVYLITNDKHRAGEYPFKPNGKSERSGGDFTEGQLQNYIDYETACFFVPYPERNDPNFVIQEYGDEDHDHEMEDDCGLWNSMRPWSRKNDPDSDYGTIAGELDEVWGHMIAYAGTLVKHPKPYVSYTEGDSSSESEEFQIEDAQDPSKNSSGFKRLMLKRQGGLVNPIFPRAILNLNEPDSVNQKLSITPHSSLADANWEVPVVGDWYKVHEGALRIGIHKELNKYIDEIDEQANNCGVEPRLNDNILTNEEILLEIRKIDPQATVAQAIDIQESEFFDRRDLVLTELQEQLYNKILNFHFSDYNPSWGTWALLSNNILATPGTCGGAETLNLEVVPWVQIVDKARILFDKSSPEKSSLMDSSVANILNKSKQTAKVVESHQCVHRNEQDRINGKPMRGLAEILSTVYWLALYKAAETKMFDDMSICMGDKISKSEEFMGGQGLSLQAREIFGSSSGDFKMKGENDDTSSVTASNLQACLAGDGDGDGSGGGSSSSGPGGKAGGPGDNVDNVILSEMFSDLNKIRSENNSKIGQNKNGITDAKLGTGFSGGEVGSGSTTSSLSPEVGSSGKKSSTGGSTSNQSTGSLSAKAKRLSNQLIKAGKNLKKGNQEIDNLVKSIGGPGAFVGTSESAFKNLLNQSSPTSNLLSGIGSVKSLSSPKKGGAKKIIKRSVKKVRRAKKASKGIKKRRLGRSRSRRRGKKSVDPKRSKENKKILKYIEKNKGKFKTEDEDSLFERITKATILNAYPVLLEIDVPDFDKSGIPTMGTQRAIELSPDQKAARKEMELLKKLDKK